MRILIPIAVVLIGAAPARVQAQCNRPGTVHLSLGVNAGLHATRYRERNVILGVRQERETVDGAFTYGFPLRVQVGVLKPLSLGLYAELGGYADSTADRSNRTFTFGFSPRFYPVNTDKFNMRVFLEGGYGSLRIDQRFLLSNVGVARYGGGHFALGTGLGFYAAEVFGLYFDLRYIRHWLPLNSFEVNDREQPLGNYEARLTTGGIQFELGFNVKFGGR